MKKIIQELPFNFFHICLIVLILFIISTKYIFVMIILVLFLVYLYKHKTIFKFSLFIVGVTFLLVSLDSNEFNSTTFNATIHEIEESNYTNKLTVKVDMQTIYVYLSKSFEVSVGDYGRFTCTKSEYNTPTYNGSFNYEEYLENSYIKGVYFASDFTYIKDVFTLSKIQYSIFQYFDNNLSANTLKYSLMLILGIDSFNDQESDVVSNLGVMHLFCISGMHINFILLSVSFILKKVRIQNKKVEVVQIIFAILLLVITNFTISVIRAFLMFVFSYIFKKINYKVSVLDVLCISAIIILIVRPNYLFLISFQLTYLVTFILIITKDLYNKKNKFINLIIQSIIAFATTFPIVVNMNYEINLLTFFFSAIISLPFSYVIMPITFISALFNLNFFEPIFVLFDDILYKLSNIDIFVFSVSKLNIIVIVFYYLLIYLLIKSIIIKKYYYRYITVLFVFITTIINFTTLNNVATVTFFDVGQGDSSLIVLPNNQGNILIDAYGGVGNYIKTRGIDKLDYVIITHAHEDHMGDLDDIREKFEIGGLICSLHDPDSKKLGCDNYVQAGDKILINNFVINFIAPYETHSDINRASLVFTISINNYIFMYTGDTTKEVEEQLLNQNIDLNADVLKVPHHGSSTSSSVEFVNAVNPDYAIFSYGSNNSYGLPNYSVVNRYTMSTNYHTPIDGHIEFYYKKEWLVRLYN